MGALLKVCQDDKCQRDHGKCDTRVPLTGRDGCCWQLACQPPLGAWQADRRSGAVALWRNKLHLLEVNAQHTRAHTDRSICLSWRLDGGSDEGRDSELEPVQVVSTFIP